MTPFVADPDFTLYVGDALDVLRGLPDESVHCCVTSPPYWGLRDYGTGSWEGGDPDCDHEQAVRDKATAIVGTTGFSATNNAGRAAAAGRIKNKGCPACGARTVDRQIGLESSPDEFVAAMVAVFREVRRVLRADGTLWLNLGDSYAGSWGAQSRGENSQLADRSVSSQQILAAPKRVNTGSWVKDDPVIKPKDLVGIPWRVAFALQADGWVLRSDITWSKSNPMPESVTDRPTKAHEMIFLFAKAKWTGPERGRYGDITDEDARWLALLFDAEGNVVVKKAKNGDRTQYGAQIAFANTSRALIERAQQIVGAGSIHERPGTNAPMFYWQMTGQQARDLLYRIYPFLIVKPRQAAVAIHMQDVIAEPKKRPGGYRTDEHTAFLDKCWQTVKSLNSFGDPDLSWVPVPRYGKWDSQPYFFDQEAVREPAEWARWGDQTNRKHEGSGSAAGWIGDKPKGDLTQRRTAHYNTADRYGAGNGGNSGFDGLAKKMRDGEHTGRNVRSVWEIATQPYPEAHFATFPEALPERCIKAGTSERGCCPECGAPWEREVEVIPENGSLRSHGTNPGAKHLQGPASRLNSGTAEQYHANRRKVVATGWRPTCDHDQQPVPCTVLDPFMGSATTALVARRLGRRSIGIELNPEYAELAARRLQQLSLLAEGAA